MRPIFPYEGIRKTPAPVVPSQEGINTATDTPYYVYTLYDRDDPTITYDMTFGDYITFVQSNAKTGPDGVTPNGGLRVNNGWILYIKGTYLYYSSYYVQNIFTVSTWSEAGDLFVDKDGYLIYTPYVPGTITGLSS